MNAENVNAPELGVGQAKRNISWDELVSATAKAIRRCEPVVSKYPELKPYVVLCCPGGQIRFPKSPSYVLRQCPEMVADNAHKCRALDLIWQIDFVNHKDQEKVELLKQLLDAVATKLVYIPDIVFDVRFRLLCYESIWRLQQDPLIDVAHTPQGKAWIRIVLCRFEDLNAG